MNQKIEFYRNIVFTMPVQTALQWFVLFWCDCHVAVV